MLLCRGAAPPLPVIGSTPDDALLAVLDPLLAPSDTGAVADGRIPSLGRQMRSRRLQRLAGAFRADRLPTSLASVGQILTRPLGPAAPCGARRQPSFLPLGFLPLIARCGVGAHAVRRLCCAVASPSVFSHGTLAGSIAEWTRFLLRVRAST